MREKYQSKILKQAIDWNNNKHIVNITLLLGGKEILFKFTLTDSKIPFKKNKSNTESVNVDIGILDSMEKFNFVENKIRLMTSADIKGFKNESFIFDIAKDFSSKNNFSILSSDKLDNKGVDFILIKNETKQKFPFQVKSSWRGVSEAKKKEKSLFLDNEIEIPIIFIVVSEKLKTNDFYNIISAEIKKQQRNFYKNEFIA